MAGMNPEAFRLFGDSEILLIRHLGRTEITWPLKRSSSEIEKEVEMFPGNKVCTAEVVITPDPIKLIKSQLIIMEAGQETNGERKR